MDELKKHFAEIIGLLENEDDFETVENYIMFRVAIMCNKRKLIMPQEISDALDKKYVELGFDI